MAHQDDYMHGGMDICGQERAFDGFMAVSTKVAIFCIVIVVGLVLFAT